MLLPGDDPRVGETWELRLDNNRTEGVIFSVTPAVITLISRTRRRASVPARSFHLMWDFLHPAPQEHCRHLGCDELAIGRIQQQNFWTWVCPMHLPAGVPLALPADRVIDQELLSLEKCPVCEAPIRILGSRMIQIDGVTVNTCGQCRREWALILGSDQSGEALVEQIDKLIARMHKINRIQAGYAVRQRLRDSRLLSTQITANVSPRTAPTTVAVTGPDNLLGTRWRHKLTPKEDENIIVTGQVTTGVEVERDNVKELHHRDNFFELFERLPSSSYKVHPMPGQVWGLQSNPRETVKVVEVGTEVRFTDADEAEHLWGLVDFLDRYGLYEPGCPCIVGEEWWDKDGHLVVVKDILFEEAEIVLEYADPPETGQRSTRTQGEFCTFPARWLP